MGMDVVHQVSLENLKALEDMDDIGSQSRGTLRANSEQPASDCEGYSAQGYVTAAEDVQGATKEDEIPREDNDPSNYDADDEVADDEAAGDIQPVLSLAQPDVEDGEHNQQTKPSALYFPWHVDDSGNPCPYPPKLDIQFPPKPSIPQERPESLTNPFNELHYFYNYILSNFEHTCLCYARRLLKNNLVDQTWCRVTLDDPYQIDPRNRFSRFEMADKEWNEPGQIEVDGWNYFFEKVGIAGHSNDARRKLFECLNGVRQAAVHRKHAEVNKDTLETAMTLPKVMYSHCHAAEMQRVYQILLQSPADRSPGDQAFFNKLLYTQDNPPVLIPQLLGQLQYSCECSAFKYAKTADPGLLTQYHADCPERMELQQYCVRWESSCSNVCQHPASLERYPDPLGTRSIWRAALKNVNDLRNDVAHRHLSANPEMSDREILEKRVEWAIRFAKLVGDEEMARKMREIADAWFAKYRPVRE